VSLSIEIAELSPELTKKHEALRSLISGYSRAIVAFSGGVDSALVLRVAYDCLGDRVRAVTARSPSLMKVELEDAVALAKAIGAPHEIVDTHELDRRGYVENSPERCYHCKTELYEVTQRIAARFGSSVAVIDGVNLDDLGDFRPGRRAADEHQVRHPLAEVGLSKREVRAISRALGLPTWNKPQLACLSSRIPYGTEVTPERLAKIEAVEMVLRGLGFFDLRARLGANDDQLVRIEVGEDEISRLLDPAVRSAVIAGAKAAGFRFVTLDLEGFRSGRMNDGLDLVQIRRMRA
jgi:pyridinium-3,5-biscarboxylic acid mononucleotide sulfurtransferase